jgi:RNA polymerase sigma factor (sigma-70 family)
MSEDEMVEGILKGTVDFAVLDDEYRPKVYRWLCLSVRNAEEAKDRTQNVLIKTYNSLPSFNRARGDLCRWIHGIADHEAKAYRRDKGPVPLRIALMDDSQEPSVAGPQDSPPIQVIWDRLVALAEDLPRRELTALYKHAVEGKTYAIIAAEMRISRMTVRRYITHATAVLKSRR